MREYPIFQEIHDTYRPKIISYLTKMVGAYEAEDLTQEVFIRVSRGLNSFRGESHITTWIYRIATNLAIDRLRYCTLPMVDGHKRAEVTSFDTEEEIGDRNTWTREDPFSVEHKIIRGEMSGCIRSCLDKLSEDYQAVLILSELEGFKNREISEIVGISIDNVKIRLHRARAMLRKEIEKNCQVYRDQRNELACEPTNGPGPWEQAI